MIKTYSFSMFEYMDQIQFKIDSEFLKIVNNYQMDRDLYFINLYNNNEKLNISDNWYKLKIGRYSVYGQNNPLGNYISFFINFYDTYPEIIQLVYGKKGDGNLINVLDIRIKDIIF